MLIASKAERCNSNIKQHSNTDLSFVCRNSIMQFLLVVTTLKPYPMFEPFVWDIMDLRFSCQLRVSEPVKKYVIISDTFQLSLASA